MPVDILYLDYFLMAWCITLTFLKYTREDHPEKQSVVANNSIDVVDHGTNEKPEFLGQNRGKCPPRQNKELYDVKIPDIICKYFRQEDTSMDCRLWIADLRLRI